ncbi:EAL domain-containing protein [Thiomicrorhabdus sediminis]|uniref:EAL domain-containing protein n=1 Tax=Thiomicrorhabdus sediminis TaxID=2580412 RepID=A0A4V1HHU6_9GAMM|nr:EAL domain-containing protein [Thiomicrorhabdus sediminis]QCU90253.1 EAL domain-containing protein [Thiomicrorhabdus sediminis]
MLKECGHFLSISLRQVLYVTSFNNRNSLLSIFLIIGFAFPAHATVPSTPVTEVKIGILSYKDKNVDEKRWQPLITYLNNRIPDHHFEMYIGNYEELENQIRFASVDFVLTQPAHFVELAHTYDLTTPLLTLANKQANKSYTQFAGVIFTSAERPDINTLEDILNKRIATWSLKSFGGFQMQAQELIKNGLIDSTDNLKMIETGAPQKSVVFHVLDNKVDVGFVRSGVIENLIKQGLISKNQLKIINQKTDDHMSLIHSTELYAEWPLFAFLSTDKKLIKKVILELMKITPESDVAKTINASGFEVAEDYNNIEEVMRSMRVGPFETLDNVTAKDIWQHWKGYITILLAFLLLSFVMISLYLFRQNQVIHLGNRQLKSNNLQLKKLNLAIEQSPVRITITNLEGQIEYVNNAVLKQSGYTLNELYMKNPRMLAYGETPVEVYENLWKTLLQGEIWNGEIVNAHKNGQRQVLESTIAPIVEKNQTIGFLSIQRDITKEKESQKKIYHLSNFDNLTGLPNANQFERYIADAIADNLSLNSIQKKNNNTSFLFLINIDRFKDINDAVGKHQGDLFLKQFAHIIQDSLPKESILSRLNGDEFGVLLPIAISRNTYEHAYQQGQVLLEHLKKPISFNKKELMVNVSIGIADILDAHVDGVDDVLKNVNTALHFAKANGGNQVQIYEKSLQTKAIETFEIEQELKSALKREQFKVYYQPQVDQSGKVMGAEALLRWFHPEKGYIPPDVFIPMAEQNDLIIEIGSWLLDTTIKEMALAIQEGNSYELSVNISPRQIVQKDFVEKVLSILKKYNVPANKLTLEITEGIFLKNIHDIRNVMHQLSEKGLKFSIDDFGTGYSSLSYIKSLSIHELKVDRVFVQNITTDPDDVMLVETMLAIANHMHYKVVIEGIETEDQVNFFNKYEGLIFQGYLYCKPCCFNDFIDYLGKQKRD